MDSKVNCQIHMVTQKYSQKYAQKYLAGIFHKGLLLIRKEYYTCAISSFSSPRRVTIACLNVIYTKFRRAMIAQLKKIKRVGVCAWNHTPFTASSA